MSKQEQMSKECQRILMEIEPKAPTVEMRPKPMTVGKIQPAKAPDIETFPNRPRITLKVKNTGDRAIQVGSHCHFFEVNRHLEFDREKAFGMKLDVPAGSAARFEPGQEKELTLVEIGGKHFVWGFNNLTNGSTRVTNRQNLAFIKARQLGFKGIKTELT
jgi:urease beta subunit